MVPCIADPSLSVLKFSHDLISVHTGLNLFLADKFHLTGNFSFSHHKIISEISISLGSIVLVV